MLLDIVGRNKGGGISRKERFSAFPPLNLSLFSVWPAGRRGFGSRKINS